LIGIAQGLRRLARHPVAGPLVAVILVLVFVVGVLGGVLHGDSGWSVGEPPGELVLLTVLMLLALFAFTRTTPEPLVLREVRERGPPSGLLSVSSTSAASFRPLRQ
jgi:hypothetical protein